MTWVDCLHVVENPSVYHWTYSGPTERLRKSLRIVLHAESVEAQIASRCKSKDLAVTFSFVDGCFGGIFKKGCAHLDSPLLVFVYDRLPRPRGRRIRRYWLRNRRADSAPSGETRTLLRTERS